MKHTDFENAKRLKMEREYFEVQKLNAAQSASHVAAMFADKLPSVPTIPRRNQFRDAVELSIEAAAERAIKEIDAEFEKL